MKLLLNKTWKLLAVVLIVTTSACGQQRGGQQRGGQQGPPELPSTKQIEKMVSDLADEILLSDEQETEVLELYKEHFEEVENKTQSGRPDRDEMETLKEDFEDDVKAVLTKDQEKLFTAYQKKNNNRPERRN